MNALSKIQSWCARLIEFFVSKSWAGRIMFACVLGISSAIVLVGLLWMAVWTGLTGPLPGKDELLLVENPVASEVYSADSVLLGRYFVQERSNLRYEHLSPSTINAVLATEDVRFFEHGGVDARSILRVLVKSLLFRHDASGGGSTLTQQLAKNLYPRRSYWVFSLPINKFREMITASRLEKVYTKQDILTLYLNTIPFGDNTFGLETASMRFYSIPASRLSADQAAVLIGMLKATHSYNPRLYPEQSQQRRNVVLSQMVKYKMLTEFEKDSLTALPIKLNYRNVSYHTGPAPYFRDYLRPELLDWISDYNDSHDKPLNLYTSGLKIYTTIDSHLQQHAENAVAAGMASTQKTFLDHWGKTEPWASEPNALKDAIRKSDHYRSLLKMGLDEGEINKIMETPVPMTIFTWDGEREVNMSPVDSIKHYLKFLNAGMLAMDPRDGAIRIWVGGINHNYFQFDHVHETTKRQVGSTFKPIIYAAALEEGVRPCQFIPAERTTYTNMEDWTPQNTADNYGLKYSMPGGLAYSVNTVSVRVLEKAGINNAVKLAQRMGIKSHLEPVPSMALGTSDISMMEMVTAFSSFANGGNAVKPFYLTSITDARKNVLVTFKPAAPVFAMSAATAAMMVAMLKRAVNEGTSSSLRSVYGLGNDIGGKTGTTQSNADGWFMAVTPRLVIGAWVGDDDRRIRFRTTALGQGARTALPLVGDMLAHANSDPALYATTHATFPVLSPALERKLSCDLFKKDRHLLRDIFVKRTRESKREFGEKKKGFWEKMFGKK